MSVKLEQRILKERVRTILLVDDRTRNDNDRLYLAVITQLGAERGVNLDNTSVCKFFLHRKEWKFPTYEAVTRCRRKLQEEDKTLRSDDNVQAMRELREEEYRKWAVAE